IAHDEVLIVDTREMKVKLPSVYCRLPHQTGVTERSISGDYRGASHHVLHQMMVGHLAYRICRCLPVALHSHHDISVSYESSLTRLCISCVRKRIKHPFEMVLPREPGRGKQRYE